MLTTGEPRGRQYRHSLYYSYNFLYILKFFKRKICGKISKPQVSLEKRIIYSLILERGVWSSERPNSS